MSALSKVGMSVFPLLVVPNQRPLLEEELEDVCSC
jgi:hypothetical protein